MTTARDIMHTGATCVGEHETLTAAAQHMGELGVGALPICGDDDRLHGMITDVGEVTDKSTEQFLRDFMEAFEVFLTRVLKVLPPERFSPTGS